MTGRLKGSTDSVHCVPWVVSKNNNNNIDPKNTICIWKNVFVGVCVFQRKNNLLIKVSIKIQDTFALKKKKKVGLKNMNLCVCVGGGKKRSRSPC